MQEISPALLEFATRYTAAWCSQDPGAVASFFAPKGSLTINDGPPSTGRAAITDAASSFMTAFPDLRVTMDRLVPAGDCIEYHWTLTGTNTGPGGTGRAVRISGFESWLFDGDGLIRDSQGSFDASDYNRQLAGLL
jgi:predicted ester cyclase